MFLRSKMNLSQYINLAFSKLDMKLKSNYSRTSWFNSIFNLIQKGRRLNGKVWLREFLLWSQSVGFLSDEVFGRLGGVVFSVFRRTCAPRLAAVSLD